MSAAGISTDEVRRRQERQFQMQTAASLAGPHNLVQIEDENGAPV